MEHEEQTTQASNEEQSFDLHQVFKNRHQDLEKEEEKFIKKENQNETLDTKEERQQKKEVTKDEKKEPEKTDVKEDKIKKTDAKPDVESEKLKKRLSESQEWGQGAHRKLIAFEKAIKKYADEGVLAEDEAKSLLDSVKHEPYEEPIDDDAQPFRGIFKVANQELSNIAKYTEDETLKDKVAAFDYFLSTADPQELQEAHEELMDLIDEPVKLARRMIAIGQSAYDESYKEILEAGNVKNLKKKYDEKMKAQDKEIDKLKKKIENYKQKYEDYTEESNVYLPSGRHDETSDDGVFDIKKVFAQKQKQLQNRR